MFQSRLIQNPNGPPPVRDGAPVPQVVQSPVEGGPAHPQPSGQAGEGAVQLHPPLPSWASRYWATFRPAVPAVRASILPERNQMRWDR